MVFFLVFRHRVALLSRRHDGLLTPLSESTKPPIHSQLCQILSHFKRTILEGSFGVFIEAITNWADSGLESMSVVSLLIASLFEKFLVLF